MTHQTKDNFKNQGIGFTQVSNHLIMDKSVSFKAKGLYISIQMHITNPRFHMNKSYLMRICKEGEKAFDTAWKELKKAGYLKIHRHRSSSGFSYEYELLDIPVIDNDDDNDIDNPDDGNNPEPSKNNSGSTGLQKDTPVKSPYLRKGGDNRNTLSNNTDINTVYNTILSYQSYEPKKTKNNKITKNMISEEEKQSNIETLMVNITPEIIKQMYPDKKDVIDEIFNIMCDTVNSNSEYITISGSSKSIKSVRNCFFKLDSGHFEYILDCLEKVTTDIRNPKAYILATIYNSHYTYNNAVNFNFNRDFKGTMFVPGY